MTPLGSKPTKLRISWASISSPIESVAHERGYYGYASLSLISMVKLMNLCSITIKSLPQDINRI